MVEGTGSLSPLDGIGVSEINKLCSLNSISAAKMSAMLSVLDGISAIDDGDIAQPR